MKNFIFFITTSLCLSSFASQPFSANEIHIQLSVSSAPMAADYISFTLHNGSAKSISLIIPRVMNPNLSPYSNSGVELKIGQEILFRVKGKNYILLTVDNNIKNGDVIEVDELLKQRKAELGLD